MDIKMKKYIAIFEEKKLVGWGPWADIGGREKQIPSRMYILKMFVFFIKIVKNITFIVFRVTAS